MIRLFDRNEVNFNHNKTILSPISCFVQEEENGMFELEIELPKNVPVANGNIIKAPTPRGEQLFRVYRSVRTLKGRKYYAKHIYYDLSNNFIIDVSESNVVAQTVLQSILNSCETPHAFTITSDILDLNTAKYERINPIQAIMNSTNGVLSLWGGNLVRNNYNIQVKASGLDRGYDIRIGKNLVGIEDDSDESSVKTRLYPTVELDGSSIVLPEKYVDSPLMNNYGDPIICEEKITLTDEQKELSTDEIYTLMRNHCNELFSKYNVDKPVVNYKIDFVELSKTEQYKDFAILEKLDLYDIVTCNISVLDINVKAKVIKYKYDCLKDRYDSIELGDFKSVSNYKIDGIVKQMVERIKATQSAVDYATNVITGNKGGYVIIRRYPNGEPYEILIMDTKDINTAVNVLRINNSGIGFSQNGFNGPYGTAMTLDGHIVADFIDTGTLTSILLQSDNYVQDQSGMKINLADGTIDSKNFKLGSTPSGALFRSIGTDAELIIENGNMLVSGFNGYFRGKLAGDYGYSKLIGISSVGNIVIGHDDADTYPSEYGGVRRNINMYASDINIKANSSGEYAYVNITGGAFINNNEVVHNGNIGDQEAGYATTAFGVSAGSWLGLFRISPGGGYISYQDYADNTMGYVYVGAQNIKCKDLYTHDGGVTVSDARRKINPTTMTDQQLKFFKLLIPYIFEFSDGTSGRKHYGFYAQQVKEAMDESGISDLDFAGFIKNPIYELKDEETGEPDTTSPIIDYDYGLRYSEFISLLTYIVQRQQSDIEQIKEILTRNGIS